MTLHVHYDHQCSACEAFYVPFDELIPCPKCGLIETERFDFIPQAAASLRFNKSTTGSFMPGAWYVGSLGDHLLHILFGLFDQYEDEGGGEDFAAFAQRFLGDMEWDGQEYLESHLLAIALRIREELGQ